MHTHLVVAACLLAPLPAWAHAGHGQPPPDLERGKHIYARACATCHGERGRGDGPTAPVLRSPPRDLTTGIYRFRTTPSGTLPSDEDLLRTVTYGLPGTDMPAWGTVLSAEDRRSVVAFVKTLAPRFMMEAPGETVVFPPPRPDGPEALARGRAAYVKAQCGSCHGDGGRGDGPSMATLKDDAGRPLPAADLTRREWKGGTQLGDAERAILTGLDGAAMPAYDAALTPEEITDLARYVLSLRRSRTIGSWLLEKP